MPTYKAKLNQLKNTLQMITNNPDYKYPEDININSTSLDLAGFLCRTMESYLENKKLLDKEMPANIRDLNFNKIDLIDKYISDVVLDDVKKQSTVPFNVNTYRNTTHLYNFINLGFSPKVSDILSKPAQIKNNIGKSFTYDVDIRDKAIDESTIIVNFTPNSPIFKHLWSSKQLSEISNTLVANFNKEANNSREGATGAVFAMFKYKGYSTDDIINGKVSQETANEIYDEIKAIGDLAKEIKSPGVSNKNQKEKKLAELNENFLYKFLNGYKKMCDEFDKNVNYEATKDINNPESMYHINNRVLSSLIVLIGTNYCQDNRFVTNLNKIYQTKPIFTNEGLPFKIQNAYDYLSDKAAGSVRLTNANLKFRTLSEVDETSHNPSAIIEKYLQLQFEMNSSFLEVSSRMNGVNAVADLSDNALQSLSIKNSTPSLNLYFKKVLKEGKLFNDLTINPQTGEVETSFSADSFEKGYNKYIQEEYFRDVDINLSRTLKKDRDFHTFSSNEEIAASINKANQYKAYTAWLSIKANEKFERVAKVVHEYQTSAKDISLLSESTIDRIYQAANEFKSINASNAKYAIFSISDTDIDFLNNNHEKAKKITDENSLKRIRQKLNYLSELTDSISFNVSVNDEQYAIMEDLNQQYKNAHEKDKFLSDISSKALDINNNDIDYKRATSPSVSFHTKSVLKDSYEVTLKKLKDSSKLDEKGEPTGNSIYFDNMYNSIKAVTALAPEDAQFNEKCKEANQYISEYIRERDSFFKLHGYGTERLNAAKNLKSLNDKYYEQIISNDEYIKGESEKVSSIFNVTHSWEEKYEVEPQKTKEPQKVKEPEKVNLQKEEPTKVDLQKEEPSKGNLRTERHVNSQHLISPLEERLGSFRQTEGVLHGASPEYKAMITDLYNLISHTKEIGESPLEIESRMNLAKMENLQLSTENYIKHKLDNPDTGSIGTKRLNEAQALKTYLDNEIKNQKIRFGVAFENKEISRGTDLDNSKKNKVIEASLEGFYNFTSPTVTLRSNNSFKDKSFTEIDYKIPSGLDKDTCCLVVLGAMLDEKLCESISTNSTGANKVGQASHSRTTILANLFRVIGDHDQREYEYEPIIVEARKAAIQAFAAYEKGDNSKIVGYIQNAIKYPYKEVSALYRAIDSDSVRYLAIEDKALSLLDKEPFKSEVKLDPNELNEAQRFANNLNGYTTIASEFSPEEIEADKEHYINQQLMKQLLNRYSNLDDSEEKAEEMRQLEENTKKELLELGKSKNRDLEKYFAAKRMPFETTTFDGLIDELEGIDDDVYSDLYKKYSHAKDLIDFKYERKNPPIITLIGQFKTSDELTASVTDLVSTSKYAQELKKLPANELSKYFDNHSVYYADKEECNRLFTVLKGKVTFDHIVAPLENTFSELKKTEGFLHGQSKQYNKMMKELDNFVKDIKDNTKEYKKSDTKKNYNKMENLLKAVDEYISYKDPQHDSGATGTKRLSEAKSLRRFLTTSITDQEASMKFVEIKTNNLRQVENVKKDLNKALDKNMVVAKTKEKTLQKEKVNIFQ